MLPELIPRINSNDGSRCSDSNQVLLEERDDQGENNKTDTALAYEVDQALWNDAAFRATDYDHIDVRVSRGIVHLYGHVSSLTNQHRAERAIQNVPGLLGINNYLIPDDRLLAEVASALGALEHTLNCKYFTGVSHGVVLLSGEVGDANGILLAEKCAAGNPNVRGVINSVHVRGSDQDFQDKPFLQPSIGEQIFFTNGISGIVRQVIINPDTRRVAAMSLWGRFADQRQELKTLENGAARPYERLIVISIDLVRYLTKDSGFLYISSNEEKRYLDFVPTSYTTPPVDWTAPYPYCNQDVLFPKEYVDIELPTTVDTAATQIELAPSMTPSPETPLPAAVITGWEDDGGKIIDPADPIVQAD